ncbi:elongation of very long chain fatty acids protein [Papilio machaon]|uniref:elongation of very long chain fatty acids protein n=1 Tax=Papilio machaon TaxID=76193 RepID=UPI001E6632AB|nr:elongation of very long chain fatty acids protein [Papilio machaon]
MKSPLPLILLTASYLIFVLKLGPKYMETRKPFKLTTFITVYNILQVTYSCALLFIGLNLISTYGLLSSSCLMETEDTKWNVTVGIYYYFFAKVTELMDTIFFVLRKKYNQVTFLHIYHHSLMMWATWISLKYEPSYGTVFLGTLNSFVHIIMYTYYALSAFPDLTKYLWWKKYITMMQLVPFNV